MKRRYMELAMGILLVVCFYFMSREAAAVTNEKSEEKVIVVDAGHGGDDPGMIGVEEIQEKGVNLQIAGKLKKLLEEDGFTVVMTRDADEGLYDEDSKNHKAQDLQNRIAVIREADPLLTVSIHQNSYEDSAVKGPQVFYYEDSVEGKRFAEILQEELNEDLSVEHPREAKGNKTYYLLKRSPGILTIVECGFLTNPEEAALLVTDDYQEKTARAIADGIKRYLENV